MVDRAKTLLKFISIEYYIATKPPLTKIYIGIDREDVTNQQIAEHYESLASAHNDLVSLEVYNGVRATCNIGLRG